MAKILIIAEKPKVAERIADSLGKPEKVKNGSVSYFSIKNKDKDEIFVVSAVGHMYGLKQKSVSNEYPIFDIEWKPIYLIDRNADYVRDYIKTIEEISKKCDFFINSCDYDIEGEIIGFNAIKFACGIDPYKENVKRMKFSTLTPDAITGAYAHLEPTNKGMADAGITRHVLDWYWGINLSKALSSSLRKANIYTTMSTGRVQGPTLKILADREREISAFVPEKYWQIEMLCEKDGNKISALHEANKIFDKEKAEKIKNNCRSGKKAAEVSEVKKKKSKVSPPPAFDLTELQTEAYSKVNIDPRRTLEIAQDLYTSGLISYPRTASNQLVDPIEYYIEIIKKLSKNYKEECNFLLNKKELKPVNGKKVDPAHPAIHPTGESAELDGEKKKIYDLITRRFFATFGDDAFRESVSVKINDNGEIFIAKGSRTVDEGWNKLYRYARFEEQEIAEVKKNDLLDVLEINMPEKETQPPKRYTVASVITELEKRNLGTKATRAVIIDTLFKRKYIEGKSISVTPLGMNVVSTLEKHCGDVLSENLTRKFEDHMDKIRESKISKEKVIEEGKKTLTTLSKKFKAEESEIGKELANSVSNTAQKENFVGKCLKCEGDLTIRSNKNGGKFIGCSKYPECKFIIALPPGLIKKEGECEECGYAVVSRITKGRQLDKFCVNPKCPANKKKGTEGLTEESELEPAVVGKCPKCGGELSTKKGMYGNFVGCSGYPKCRFTLPLPKGAIKKAGKCEECGYLTFTQPVEGKPPVNFCINPECSRSSKEGGEGAAVDSGTVVVGKCKKCGGDLRVRQNRFGGNFIGCSNYPKCKNIISLPKGTIKKAGECNECGQGYSTVTRIVEGKEPQTFCINPECPSKKK